jgi:HK97 family phage prohead protease
MTVMEQQQQAPTGTLEYREASLVSVSFPDRTIELIVMPYETETGVIEKGKRFTEIVSRGAFDGIERRANRIRVNRDHDVTRTVGRALALHPSRDEGLVAELRIAQTQLGDETLALADEGILDASAGFLPMPNGETWEGRDRRRLTKLWLGHIAMTPDPAYETARVLAVRSQSLPEATGGVSTPNLDKLFSLIREDRYASLELGR